MEEYSEFLKRSELQLSRKLQLSATTRILKWAFKYVENPNSAKVLEIGAGLGIGFVASKKLGVSRYEAVEPTLAINSYLEDEYEVVASRAKLPNLFGFKSEEFDVVFSFHVLEHAKDSQEALEWVKEMSRVCKSTGLILVVCPDIRDYGEYFWDSDWTHGFPTTPNRIAQLFEGIDLELIEVTNLYFGFKPNAISFITRTISRIIPIKLLDRFFSFLGKRNLASSALMLLVWGESIVLARKKSL